MSFWGKINSVSPEPIRNLCQYLYHHMRYDVSHYKIKKKIECENKVRVAFVVMNLSMWKNQPLLELLIKDSRFEVKVVLSPALPFDIEQQDKDIDDLRKYFDEHNVVYEDFDREHPYDLKLEFGPQIVFFTQSYSGIHCREHDYPRFNDCLICYIPYSFWPGAEPWGFDLPFHRYAWRIYYANKIILEYARSVSLVRARNCLVSGYPSADQFRSITHRYVWRNKDKSLKRIIWAPHYTITSDRGLGESHSSFFDLQEGMLEYAKNNQDTVQIAFKPHPRLKTELYKEWGKEKTDRYYEQWASMPNTQLETGSYIDLFMTSDALVHECGSFMIEYHYSKKPCMYVMKDFEKFYASMNNLGQRALDLHYKGANMADVEAFINSVVFDGNDPLLPEREHFYRTQLLPPNGKTTAQNIYEDLVKSLFPNS